VAATAVAAGAAGVLMARGAARGAAHRTEAMAGAMVRVGDAVRAAEDRHFEPQRVADLWRDAAALVMERNAHIMSLRAAAQGAAVEVGLPAPLRVAGTSLSDLHGWCCRVDEQLTAVRAKLTSHTADRARRRLTARLTPVDAATTSVAEALAARRAGLKLDIVAAPGPGQIEGRVEDRLRHLDPGVDADAYAHILETAARATTATSELAQRSNLDLLGQLVKDANQATRKRRDHALAAGRLLQAFAAVDLPGSGPGDASAALVVARLTEVVEGRCELDADLDTAAEELRQAAAGRAEQRYVTELVTELMAQQGFAVTQDAHTFRLTRDGWSDHRAELRIADRHLSGEVVRNRSAGGAGTALLDRERCEQFTESLTWLAEMLHAAGVQADVTIEPAAPVRYEPGVVAQTHGRRDAAPLSRMRSRSPGGSPPA
jgi:hypothetical protein